jgi:pimeloyl-ACP methyl ester carboxylesterase
MVSKCTLIIIQIIFLNCMFNPITPENQKQKNHGIDIKFENYEYLGKKISFAISGENSKQMIFFIHGSPGSWKAYLEYLQDPELNTKAILISADRLGYGGSEKGIPEYSLENQAKYLSPILNLYPKSEIVLVGHSYGGPVAIQIAGMYPDRIKKIILLAPSIDPELEEILWYQKFGNTKFGRFLLPSSIDVSNQEIYTLKEELLKQNKIWKKLNIPIIHIHGTSDSLVPFSNTEYSIKNIQKPENLKIITLKEVNHFIVWNHFALIKEELLKSY